MQKQTRAPAAPGRIEFVPPKGRNWQKKPVEISMFGPRGALIGKVKVEQNRAINLALHIIAGLVRSP